MWLQTVVGGKGDDTEFIYIPSWAHGRNIAHGPYPTWKAAMAENQRVFAMEQPDMALVSSFWPIVLECDQRPELYNNTFKMVVRRIPLGEC